MINRHKGFFHLAFKAFCDLVAAYYTSLTVVSPLHIISESRIPETFPAPSYHDHSILAYDVQLIPQTLLSLPNEILLNLMPLPTLGSFVHFSSPARIVLSSELRDHLVYTYINIYYVCTYLFESSCYLPLTIFPPSGLFINITRTIRFRNCCLS